MGLGDACRTLGSKIRSQNATFSEALNLLAEVSTPDTPNAGYVKLYAKDDKRIYMLDSNGKETMLEVPLNVIDTVLVDASLMTSGVWYEVLAATSDLGRRVQIFDTSGNTISWSIDTVPVSPKFLTGAGTNETMDIEIPAGSKISAKIDEAGPLVGQIVLNVLG